MTICLLCQSQAVADGLCVADGARLWLARAWLLDPDRWYTMLARKREGQARPLIHPERWDALDDIRGPNGAKDFIARLDAAGAERKRAEDERIRRRDGET